MKSQTYVDVTGNVCDAEHSELVGGVALKGLQLLSGHQTRVALIPVGSVYDHGRVRGNVLVEGRSEQLGVSKVFFMRCENTLGLVANVIFHIDLSSVDAIQTCIYKEGNIRC